MSSDNGKTAEWVTGADFFLKNLRSAIGWTNDPFSPFFNLGPIEGEIIFFNFEAFSTLGKRAKADYVILRSG